MVIRHAMGSPPWESNKARKRREREEQQAKDYDERMREQARVAALSLYERIEECSTLEEIKAVLHFIREKIDG